MFATSTRSLVTAVLVTAWAPAIPAGAAVVAWDGASDPAYADGWQAGDNGGTGFLPWQFENLYDPASAARLTAQFVATNTFVDIPASGPAWGQGSDNRPFYNATATAIRPLAAPLETGQTLSFKLDNPVLDPLDRRDVSGMVVRLFNDEEEAKFALFAQSNFQAAHWTIYDLDRNGVDTGLSTTDTAGGGLRFSLTLTGPETYELTLDPLDGAAPVALTGTLLRPGLPVTQLRFVIYGNGSATDGSRELYVNNLSIVPEPSMLLALGAGWLFTATRPLRRRRARQ